MLSNKNKKLHLILQSLMAWILAVVTVVGAVKIERQPKVVVNNVMPVYAYVDSGSQLYNRNDNENETVHMPTEYDIGIRTPVVTGKK